MPNVPIVYVGPGTGAQIGPGGSTVNPGNTSDWSYTQHEGMDFGDPEDEDSDETQGQQNIAGTSGGSTPETNVTIVDLSPGDGSVGTVSIPGIGDVVVDSGGSGMNWTDAYNEAIANAQEYVDQAFAGTDQTNDPTNSGISTMSLGGVETYGALEQGSYERR